MFEAEPLEPDGMTAPPRRRDAHLFDRAVLVRGLWQGMGLLATLLATCALARRLSHSDKIARALTFSVMVFSNLVLIAADRRLARSSSTLPDPSTRPLLWMAGAASVLLGCVLGLPWLGKLFAFVTPSPLLLAGGTVVVMLNWLWFEFEFVKWWLRRRRGAPCEK